MTELKRFSTAALECDSEFYANSCTYSYLLGVGDKKLNTPLEILTYFYFACTQPNKKEVYCVDFKSCFKLFKNNKLAHLTNAKGKLNAIYKLYRT